MSFQDKAKPVIQPNNLLFSAAVVGWINFSLDTDLRACTSISQKLPKISECVLIKFYADAARFIKIEKYSFTLVGNMNQTRAFFDMVSSKCIVKKGVRECVSRSSGSEKKHLTILLSPMADEQILVPMIIFMRKTDRIIPNLNIPPGFIVKTQEKAWMDDNLMKVWVEDIWPKHT